MSTPTSAPQPHPSDILMQIGFGFAASAALNVVARLGIADLLAKGPQSTKELAKATEVNEDCLYRTMRTLASIGVFKEVSLGQFALTPISEELRSNQPGSMRDAIRFLADPWHFRMYSHMLEVIKTGKMATEVDSNEDCWTALAKDRAENDCFNAAMTSLSARVMPAILEAYDFSYINTLVDVAGGHGFVLTSILKQYPKMKGIVMDQAHVIDGANATIRKLELDDRAKAEAGDFFKAVPKGGDAYIMKHIIHDWDDEKSIAILRTIHTALEGVTKGQVILLEGVVPPGNDPHPSKFMDIEMMMLPGGRERTEAEYRNLFKKAGFELKQIMATKSPLAVIVAERV
ncbi:MAG TPA: methyltransferase [Terriglobales bacterium]|nr:methyltransferase [Terriglobales bacterium]